MARITGLSDRGRSILITTHVMDEAEKTNRVAFLFDGVHSGVGAPPELEKQYGVSTIEDVFLKAEKEEEHAHISNH